MGRVTFGMKLQLEGGEGNLCEKSRLARSSPSLWGIYNIIIFSCETKLHFTVPDCHQRKHHPATLGTDYKFGILLLTTHRESTLLLGKHL